MLTDYYTELHEKDTKNQRSFLCDTLGLPCGFFRKNIGQACFTAVLFLLGFQASFAQEVDIGGYVKELGQISINNDFSTLHYDNILHHRIESDWTLSDHFEFRADLRTRLLNGYTVNNTPAIEQFYEQDPNYFDLSWIWFHNNRSLMHSNIDRMHLSYINGPWEVHAGRQRVNWGRTMAWNPNDLFNNYAFLDFDYEERPGVDALTAQYNWSYASSSQVGIRLGDNWNESVIAALVRTSWKNYDIQIIGGHYLDNLTLGTGWAGYLGDAGFKGEISYFHPENQFFKHSGHVNATAGFDYMLQNGVYLQGELLYNGGYNQRGNPLNTLVQPPSADNLFIAKSGFLFNGSYQIHPLVNGNISFMGSFDRSIFIAIPQITFSVTEDIDLLLLSQLLKGSVFKQAVQTPNLFFFRLTWSY
ncbi:hypothetical protein [Fodinibius sp. AD559]|uniref:hypothetical protein n=1 Tax=Fodinibius sp. AD559 TaxID=3424179 RepID=UPI004046F9F6